MFGARNIFFVIALIVIVLGVGLFFVQLYFSYFKLDRVFEVLRNSYGAQIRKPMLGRDPMSRLFLSTNFGIMLVYYKRSIINGELDVADYRNFPSSLLLFIKFMHFSAVFLGGVMVLLFVVGKSIGWL
ncbi:hypothetical protein T3H00_07050 [Pseudomonas fluorescens]|jgi:hypothetical protein|uniref:hypothetical protein n=1 Tax=Pseudomonas TaxID=286 RepID=UPI001A932849|nr:MULTISPECIES: hypothetical protein [Pseudomonas]MDZ5432419.1 hypothetical protein [Pseudomonas fluorescens]